MNSISLSKGSKNHYTLLDGLRGVAALAIVIFHFMEIIITDFSKNILAHGFLAVDFFFCLSGFVMAYAYDGRMNTLHLTTFLKQRLKRLHPLVVLGSTLGVLAFLFDPFSDASTRYSILQIVGLFLTSVLLLPYPVMEDRYFNLFGLNAPSWSLFWEYIANIVYALVLVRLPRKVLGLLAVVGALLLFYIAKTSGNLLGGWNGETFWHGGARLFYSFLAGMCLLRYRITIPNRLGFAGLSFLLIAAFLIPYHPDTNWFVEPLLVMVYFPLLIALGAGSTRAKNQESVCLFSGQLSYPLYMTHYAVMWAFGSYYSQIQPTGSFLILVISVLILLQFLIAYVAMRYYDLPLRARLNRKQIEAKQKKHADML